MHLKFLARGTGSAAVAAAYLLALKDASGKVRAAVEVLRGDPMLVAAVADGLPFKHRYTSGVGAWSPEDAPTRPELERFADEFEKTAWAGLEPDRYMWAVVLHRDDDGGVHVHFLAARCDLATGSSLNIAPPGWERTFDPLRDAFNYEHGWSRPDDPSRARARAFRPAPHRAYQARAAGRAGEAVKPDPRREIGMHLLELVAAGRVKDRSGVVSALEERGYDVPRQGEHYVTARDRATGERWRLKGGLYERAFDRARFLREAPEPSGDRERTAGDADPAAAAWEAVEKARRRRADYNRANYGPSRRPGREGVQAGGAGEVQRKSGPAAGRSLAAHLERELGDGAVAAVADAAEPRRANAGGSRGERSLAAALAEAARAAGPELSRALGEHEHVIDRERAVCATSMGEQWLAEAQQEVLAEEEDRPLSVGVRTRAVKTAEGRLETHLSRRAAEAAATSSGPALLQEAFGKRSYGDAPLSFSARERDLERVEQRIDEELRTQEETLRAIPPGKRYLSAAEQARAAGTAGPPTLADRESMVRSATQQVGEELDRLEEELLAIAGVDALLVGALAGAGRTRSLGERWEACEGTVSGVEEELDRREAAIRADSAGEESLRAARLDVLGSAEHEAAALGERARIVKAAAEAKRQAETWNEEKASRVEKLGALPGGLDLYHAHLADRDPKWSLAENTPPSREHDEAALVAAESDGARLKRLAAVLSVDADAACYQEVLDQVAGQFKTSDLDRAVAAGEEEGRRWGKKRNARLDALERQPGGQDLYHAHLAELDPAWGVTGNTTREQIDAALAAAESDSTRLKCLRGVLSDEAAAARYHEELGKVAGQFKTSDLDRALAAGERERAERSLQQWRKKRDARVDALRTLPGGLDLYHARLADLDPKSSETENATTSRQNIDAALTATESDGVRQKRLRVVRSDEAATACYQQVLDQVVGQFKTPDLDRALAAGERERAAAAERREAEERRREHVEKREEALRATSLGGRWLAEAHQEARAGAGRELALVVRERIADTVESRFASDLARREASLAATASGLALLRKEYGEAAIADPPRSFLRRERVVEQGEREAKRDARFEALGKQPGGMDLFNAHLADLDPAWDRKRNNTSTREHIDAAMTAAESDGRRLERLHAVLSDKAAEARYREVLADVPGQFNTSDLDTALASGERERQAEERRWAAAQQRRREKRFSRVEQALSDPKTAEAFIAALDAQNPSWRTGASPDDLDQALDATAGSSRVGRKPPSWQHQLVFETERTFPKAPSTACRGAGGRFDRTTAGGGEGWRVSQMLSDRALARAFAAEKAEPPAPRNLAQRLFDWLWTQVERLLRERAASAEAEARRKREAAAAAARQQRWDNLKVFPGAQDAARDRFDQLERGWRDKGSASPQCFNRVVGEIEGRIDKSLKKHEERLRDRNRDWDYQAPDRAENLLERASADVLGQKPSTWQERAPVLHTADLLDVADRAFEGARQEVAERWKVTPPHHTVREAAAAALELEQIHTPWGRAVAEAIVGGKAQPRYHNPTEGEDEQFLAKRLADDKAKAESAADRQHQEELNAWRQKNRLFRGREPERPPPKDPEPPTASWMALMREDMIRFMRNRIVGAIRHYEQEFKRERERDNRANLQEETTRSRRPTPELGGRGR